MTLSRRTFLKSSGILAAFGLSRFPDFPGAKHQVIGWHPLEQLGRVFSVAPVYLRPDLNGPITGQLMPDSVIDITPENAGWYQVVSGYIQCSAVQPIAVHDAEFTQGIGFYAEMTAPISVIREWCSGRAPIIERIGYGAVFYVIDRLQDDQGRLWYGLAPARGESLIGWAHAEHYHQWQPTPCNSALDLALEIQDHHLLVYGANGLIGQTPIYGPSLPSLQTTIQRVMPGMSLDGRSGVPWVMSLATGTRVYGAYWHNQFGTQSDGSQPYLELPTFAAKWLYEHLENEKNLIKVSILAS